MQTNDTQNMDAKLWIFEVRNGVLLALGERNALPDGWFFGSDGPSTGPFATALEAIDAAAEVSADLNIVETPKLPLAVTDPKKIMREPTAEETSDVQAALERLVERGYVERKGDRYRITKAGRGD